MIRPKITMAVAMGMLAITALFHLADTPTGAQAQPMAPATQAWEQDGVSSSELMGAQVGDTLSNGWVVTSIRETGDQDPAGCKTCGAGKASRGKSCQRSRVSRTVRGKATKAFMRRGPLRRASSGLRANRLQRIADSGGPRSRSAKRRLSRMAGRGIY